MFLPLTLDLGQSEKYILSVRISTDKFMFSIMDPENRKNYCLRETSFPPGTSILENVKKIVFDFNFLTQQYKQTNVIIVSSGYDIVPKEYFLKNRKKDIYEYVHFGGTGKILFNENTGLDIITLYNCDKELFEFLSRNLYDPRFYHHTNLLVSYFQGLDKSNTSDMIIYSHDDLFDIFCYSARKLIHSITLTETSPLNQVYYILKVWESCDMDQLNDILYLAGDIDESVISTLQKYIKNIEKTGAFSDVYLWNEDAEKAPLDLLALTL